MDDDCALSYTAGRRSSSRLDPVLDRKRWPVVRHRCAEREVAGRTAQVKSRRRTNERVCRAWASDEGGSREGSDPGGTPGWGCRAERASPSRLCFRGHQPPRLAHRLAHKWPQIAVGVCTCVRHERSLTRIVRPPSRESPAVAGLSRYGASRTRTGDLLGAIQALSQLSYSPRRRRSERTSGSVVVHRRKFAQYGVRAHGTAGRRHPRSS
jgi:hypothetical protein